MSGIDAALNSGLTSAILRSLWESDKSATADLSYDPPGTYPNIIYYNEQITPYTGQAFGSDPQGLSSIFYLLRSGFWDSAVVEVQMLTCTDTTLSTNNLRLYNLFQKISLESNNSLLFNCDGNYLYCRTVTEEDNIKLRSQELCNFYTAPSYSLMDSGGIVNKNVSAMVPLYMPSFESIRNAFDLGFLEQIRLTVQFNNPKNLGLIVTNANESCIQSVANVYLRSLKHTYDSKSLGEIRARNFKVNDKLSLLSYDTLTEQVVCTQSAGIAGSNSFNQGNTIILNNNFCIRQMWCMIRENGVASYDEYPTKKILGYQFAIGGSNITSGPYVPGTIQNYFAKKTYNDLSYAENKNFVGYTSSSSTTALDIYLANQYNVIPILEGMTILHLPWCDYPNNRIDNTGSLSMSSVSVPTFIFYTDTITAANYNAVVVQEFLLILDFITASGMVTRSVQT